MSLHHRPLRSSITTVAITGAAALATVLAGSPAMANDATVADPVDATQAPESRHPPPRLRRSTRRPRILPTPR